MSTWGGVVERLEAGGPVVIPILLLGFLVWFITLVRAWELRGEARGDAPGARWAGPTEALLQAAPLLGLFGTVRGMIQTFQALFHGATVDGVTVADGISQALITTQLGLLVAIPGLVVHRLLQGREARSEVRGAPRGPARGRRRW